MNMNDEETGKWVILSFFPHEPTDVYGLLSLCGVGNDHFWRSVFVR